MKKDIDAIMEKHDLDAILVTGAAKHNPAMHYFTGNVHVDHADLIKKRGAEPVLFYNPMEREEAAKTGMETRNLAEYHFNKLLKEADGDQARAYAMRYKKMLEDAGVTTGRMAIYGLGDAGEIFAKFSALQKEMPEVEIVGQLDSSVILEAMETKDEEEVARLRRMGQITAEVVDNTAKFLRSHKVKDNVLVKADGKPLTIGDVKKKINLWALERGVENPHGVIFAIGHDAGVPHSMGAPEDVLELGKTIVYDIFLQEPGGGYHADFTRTWCLGYAPEAEQKLYDEVRTVFDDLMGGLEANAPFNALHLRTCDLFEEMGHATSRTNPLTQEGYVHGLGHGLGLNIHEQPFSRQKEATLKPGVVVTIEPGLYYPDKDMGCRIEDTIYVHDDGEIEILADYPYDLVLEVGGEE
jgi:Xaa-Pro aminopeptidase